MARFRLRWVMTLRQARRLIVLVVVAGLSSGVLALYEAVEVANVPVERVVANLERQVAGSPRDVGLLINLARVHAMAFALKTPTIPTGNRGARARSGRKRSWTTRRARSPKRSSTASPRCIA